MKTFEINYAIRGMLTILPLYSYIQAENVEQAQVLFEANKSENEIFCAIREIETPTEEN